MVDALNAARALSDPDRGSAVLHHHRPDLFPLLSRHTVRVTGAVASARSTTPWVVIHQDLTTNDGRFARLEEHPVAERAPRLTRLRLHDLLSWLVVTRRWADVLACIRAG